MSLRLAIAGAGLIGRRHAEAVALVAGVELAAVVDPAAAGAELAARHGARHFPGLAELLERDRPDGVILATPNQLHVEQALACVAAGVPALVEKPLATDLEGAERIVAAGKAAGVPLLTGHHRRHNPLVARARELLARGDLGRIVAVNGQTWFFKPEDYFEADWRRRKGAGPVYLNLIHDIDMLRHLCGEIASVQALASRAVRGFEVEDTAAVLLGFANGAVGTLSVSDTVVAPWSWELTSRENPAYPATPETCYWIGGTEGALALPNLALWANPGKRSWWEPIAATSLPVGFEDPLVAQLRQFAAVIRGEAAPLVSAEEGLRNQRVIDAVQRAAASGEKIGL